MLILGLNTFHADTAAVLVDGDTGKLIAAIAEERLNRVKHFAGFPDMAIRECLRIAGATPADVTHVAVARDSKANLVSKLGFSLRNIVNITKMAKQRLENRAALAHLPELVQQAFARAGGTNESVHYHHIEHHLAHLASAFLVSDFQEAALCSIDGFGDFASTMTGMGKGTKIEILDRTLFPHSLGVLYTSACQFIAYNKYGDEGKIMGLAPYGKENFRHFFDQIISLEPEGRFKLNLQAFIHHTEGVDYHFDERGYPHVAPMFNAKFWTERLGPVRDPKEPLSQRDMDIARSLQACLERAYMHILNHLYNQTKTPNLCLAGGVALNSVANGLALEQTPFKHIYVQPAAGDDGTAVGAAYYVYHNVLNKPRNFRMIHAYTGSSFNDAEIKSALDARGLTSENLDDATLYDRTAECIAEGLVVGWFQGQMEWGPRALGNRSIVAHPGHPKMKDILNARIKHREWFRPFAPSILTERLNDYFESTHPSPFMLMVYNTKPEKREELQAVNHVDNTGRVQTVSREENPRYYDLIKAFERRTGTPVVLNTSFNENEPVVNTPAEAIDCFLRTKMDILVLGNHFCRRPNV